MGRGPLGRLGTSSVEGETVGKAVLRRGRKQAMRSEGRAGAGEGSTGVVGAGTTESVGNIGVARTGGESVQAGDEGTGGFWLSRHILREVVSCACDGGGSGLGTALATVCRGHVGQASRHPRSCSRATCSSQRCRMRWHVQPTAV